MYAVGRRCVFTQIFKTINLLYMYSSLGDVTLFKRKNGRQYYALRNVQQSLCSRLLKGHWSEKVCLCFFKFPLFPLPRRWIDGHTWTVRIIFDSMLLPLKGKSMKSVGMVLQYYPRTIIFMLSILLKLE